MKSSLLFIFLSLFTFGTINFISSEKHNIENEDFILRKNVSTSAEFDKKIDSIENLKSKEIEKYESQIKSSFKTIKIEEAKQKEFTLLVDSLYLLAIAPDTIIEKKDTIIETEKPKKQSWLKKQLKKLKK